MELELVTIAFLIGIATNLEPCCGGANVLWAGTLAGSSDARDRVFVAGLGVGRSAILAGIGVFVGLVGWVIDIPLALGFIVLSGVFASVGLYELRKASRASSGACPVAFDRHGRSRYINGLMLPLPPPLVFVLFGLLGDVTAIDPVEGGLALGVAGLGLGVPLFIFAASPRSH